MKCPLCRTVFEHEDNTSSSSSAAASLSSNYFVKNVLAAGGADGGKEIDPNNVICEICEDHEDAAAFCLQCLQYYCAGCQRGHKKQRSSTGHEFVSVEEALKGKMKPRVVHCEKHPHQEVNSYCRLDMQAICSECVVDFHKGHDVDRLTAVAHQFKEEMSAKVNLVFFFFFFFLFSFPQYYKIDEESRWRDIQGHSCDC